MLGGLGLVEWYWPNLLAVSISATGAVVGNPFHNATTTNHQPNAWLFYVRVGTSDNVRRSFGSLMRVVFVMTSLCSVSAWSLQGNSAAIKSRIVYPDISLMVCQH